MRRVAVTIFGHRIELVAPVSIADDLLRALTMRALVVRCKTGAEASEIVYEIRDRGRALGVVRIDESGAVLVDVTEAVAHAAELVANDLHRWIADRHPELLMVHAGAVAWRDVAVLVPGRSHSGKSSLVVAMLEAGAGYLSDEFAPLDASGDVHPYPRHLSLRGADGGVDLVAASELGARTVADPTPVRVVVDTRYEPDASFRPERRYGATSLMVLADNVLVARSRPAHTMKIIARLVPQVTVLRSARGDAATAARAILDAVDDIVDAELPVER